MAGLLYLPRLFVYHAQQEDLQSDTSQTFVIMEEKLLRFIMNPAMIATWVLAILMFKAYPELVHETWMSIKLICVIAMSAIHGVLAKYRKQFKAGTNTKSHKFYRWLNEGPTVLMIIIVLMAVAKPGF
jgi:putative membrane protein